MIGVPTGPRGFTQTVIDTTMDLPRVEPVFVKASDIPDFKSLKEFEMCQAVCTRIAKESLLGVQRIGMLWRLYLNDKESRVVLLANKITLRGQTVNVFSNNPMRAKLSDGETDENVVKITIKDLPISKGNNGIEQYLISNGIKLRTKIQYAKARDENNQLTDWLNGDRIVFTEKFADPLPRKTWINDSSVRIFHRDQPTSRPRCSKCHQEGHYRRQCTGEECCIVCKDSSHQAGDPVCSGSAKQVHKQVTAFAGKLDPLSNFYPCEIRVFGVKHRSAEHAYQYSKAIQGGKDTIANRILESDTAYHAKTEASYLPYNPNWGDQKEKVMQTVLQSKAKYCPEFREALINSENVIAEAVPGELFWSTGLNKEITLRVKKASWPGKNRMGKLLSTLREEIQDSQKKKAGTRSTTRNSQKQNQDHVYNSESDYGYED